MKCPACNVELKMAERQGVEIDYCPQCRGVWLDRGELDKIIARSSGEFDDDDREDRTYRGEEHHPRPDYRHRKRKSFFDELFDF